MSTSEAIAARKTTSVVRRVPARRGESGASRGRAVVLAVAVLGLGATASGQMRTHSQVCAERGEEPGDRPIDEAAPLYHVRADSPPWLILCAAGEAAQAENAQMAEALRTAGHPDCTLVVAQGRDHMGMVTAMADPADEVAGAILGFIRRQQTSR